MILADAVIPVVKRARCVILRESLTDRVPPWLEKRISVARFCWLDGVQLTEALEIDIEEHQIPRAIGDLTRLMRPSGYLATISCADQTTLVFARAAGAVTERDGKANELSDRLVELEINHVPSVDVSAVAMPIAASSDGNGPPSSRRIERGDLFRPSVTERELNEQTTTGEICVCGRVMTVSLTGALPAVVLHVGDLDVVAVLPSPTTPDIGDIVGVRGTVNVESSTLAVKRWGVLTRTRTPLLFGETVLVRPREIQLLTDRRLRSALRIRREVIKATRDFLDRRGFLEVDTPVLLPVRDISPVPHFSVCPSVSGDHVLRTCPENALKRLVVSGFDRVYEIARNFRIEESGGNRLSEFTTVECYAAYTNYLDMAALCEELVLHVVHEVRGADTRVMFKGRQFDVSAPWARLDYRTSVLRETGIDVDQHTNFVTIRNEMTKAGLSTEGLRSRRECLNRLAEIVESSLVDPSFLMDHPMETICVAKRHGDAALAHRLERFEAFVGGIEIAHAFTELSDSLEQRERMLLLLAEKVAAGDEPHLLDEAFLTALDIGLPPTAGLGVGIDRLVMLLTEEPIERVIAFPPQA